MKYLIPFLLLLLFQYQGPSIKILGGGAKIPQEALNLFLETPGKPLLITYEWYSKEVWNKRFGERKYDVLVLSPSINCNSVEVANIIMGASSLMLDGGDQKFYVAIIENTLLEYVLNIRMKQVPVLATSAGSMILGEFVFSAKYGSVYSDTIDEEDEKDKVTIQRFLKVPQLKNVIVDTHFSERGREGRLRAFLDNINKDYHMSCLGLGIDESTAIILEGKQFIGLKGRSSFRVVGQGSAFLFYKGEVTQIGQEISNAHN